MLIKDYLVANKEYFVNTNWISYTFILNSKTSANNICDLIEEKISFKLKKNTVSPPNNKNCLILIEDLNMPNKERFGAQPPIEILRQYFDYGGWYDRKEKDFLYLNNLLIFSFITTGRPLISSRLMWHFIPFPMNEIDDSTLKDIYSTQFLSRFFDSPPALRKLQDSFTDAIVSSFKNTAKLFRPLPSTPHYSFNVRDLNKVFEGLTLINNDLISNRMDQSEYMISLLLHETMRVYCDRLINDTDRNKFKMNILIDIQRNLSRTHNFSVSNFDNILFSEFNRDYSYQKVENIELLKEDIYKNIIDYNGTKKTKEKIDIILFDYSLRHLLRIDRILTRNAEHGVLIGLTGSGRQSLTNIAALIKKYKIYKTRTREEVDEYGRKEWLEDIKTLYSNAGLKKESTIFIIKDNNITDEAMYVDLNCIISSGIVYNLFSNEEKAEWIGNIKQMKDIEDMNLNDDQSIWDTFLSKTMQRLRVILCINPLNINFSKILRSFPALINSTTIDWYESWPEPALYYLAEKEFYKENFAGVIINSDFTNEKLSLIKKSSINTETEESIEGEVKTNELEILQEIALNNKTTVENLSYIFSKTYYLLTQSNEDYYNETRKKVIILPKSYLDYIKFFKSFYELYSNSLDKKIKKYSEGVKKIDEAGAEILKMSQVLEIKKPILIEKSKFMETTIKEIEVQTKDAQDYRQQCEENEKIALAKSHEAEYKKKIAEFNKQEAEILKEEINKKIAMIDKKEFMALRSFRVPPKEVTKMMQAISVIMSNFEKKPLETIPKEWEFFKKKLNDVKLLQVLQTLPKKLENNLLSDKIIKLYEPFIVDPDLDPTFMEKKISSTCACFCVYVQNMYQLDKLLKEKIIPSIKESELATSSFISAQENLDIQKKNLMQVEQQLAELTNSFNEKNLEKQQLEFEISESQKKLLRAQRLTSKLAGEKKRWAEIAENEEKNKIFILGDVIIASFYISFMGPYLNYFRDEFLKNCVFPILEDKKILFTKNTSICKVIGNPFKIQDWIINGLPSDPGSIDNAVILFETTRPCLLIDPQKQALKFLNKVHKNDFCIYKRAEGSNSSISDSTQNAQFIENCIKTGKVLIFDYVSFDVLPEVETLLNSEVITVKGVKHLKLNENVEITLHPKFKFYLISYLPSPVFNPELYGKISIINFSVTKSGLTEQLLSVIIKEESPNDEMEKINILQKQYQLSETINRQEEEILERLNVSSETLLDNDTLIVNLEDSKKLADEATIQINSAKITEERIDNFRMLYLPLANLGTLIFFVLSELSLIEDIYQFSISWFIKDIVIQSIKDLGERQIIPKGSNLNNILEKRLEALTRSLLEKAYIAVCRSLLNKDKNLFSFLLLIRKLQVANEISEDELQFLFNDVIKVNIDDNMMEEYVKMKPDYIDISKWKKIIKLNQIECYKGILNEIAASNQEEKEGNTGLYFLWKEYIISGRPNNILPSEKFNNLHPMKKLLLIKIFNLETLIPYIKEIISDNLCPTLSKIPLFTINDLYEMSSFSTPLMLIMTPGLDPSDEVKKIAEENNKELLSLSLGQGQSKKALASIEISQKKGTWVFLQNLHLVPDFMKSLEQVINNLQTNEKGDINAQFRLWISALPTNNILPSILVNSLKITLESPAGVKSNLKKLLKSQQKIWLFDYEMTKRINKEYEFTKFLICLMHFHAILLERKNYGPLGWNIKYNFNESDFLISKIILKTNLEKHALSSVSQLNHSGSIISTNLNASSSLPYKAIIYLTADCIYGGRVTDDWDRRTLYSILEDFYNDKVINDEVFNINNLEEYSIPFYENYESYLNKFENELPDNDRPEVLGLHPNALIRKQMEESRSLLNSFANLNKGDSNPSNANSAKNVILNNINEQANKKLIRNFNIEEVKKKFPLIYEDCMNSILIQEIMRYNSLLTLVFKTLEDTLKAFQGLIPLTDEFEEVANQVVSNKTPYQWIKASYPSKKPIGSWIIDLEDRIKFFNNWINNGIPYQFLFSAFFFTQSFLTGIKQNFARKYKISIDKLEFDFFFVDSEFYNKGKIESREAYFTYGLYIEGAEWNNQTHTIDELTGNKINSIFPPIILTIRDSTIENINNKDKGTFLTYQYLYIIILDVLYINVLLGMDFYLPLGTRLIM